MKKITFVFCLLLYFISGTTAFAHPGSGIVVDKFGNVFFTDTGKGVWKIDTDGNLTFIPASRFHWMGIDEMGYFSKSQKNFGQYFERVTAEDAKPALIMCSDFPLVVNKNGIMYYADTRPAFTRIMKRTADGKESVLVTDKVFQFIGGIASGADGSLYITESSDANANTIRKISMNGAVTILATFTGKRAPNLPSETVPSYCRGLVVDSTGSIYVAATGSRSVLKITPQGKIETILEESTPWTPTAVAVFKGEKYILEWHDVDARLSEVREAYIPRVRKIALDGTVKTLATVSRD